MTTDPPVLRLGTRAAYESLTRRWVTPTETGHRYIDYEHLHKLGLAERRPRFGSSYHQYRAVSTGTPAEAITDAYEAWDETIAASFDALTRAVDATRARLRDHMETGDPGPDGAPNYRSRAGRAKDRIDTRTREFLNELRDATDKLLAYDPPNADLRHDQARAQLLSDAEYDQTP